MLRFIFALLTFTATFCNFISIGECREVVFVINSGHSMNNFDPFHTAPESVVWGSQNFSDNDEVGIITFNNKVDVVRKLSKIKDNPVNEISIEYSGTSDAGAGLLAAMDMLTPKFNTQRDIIFITSGENLNAQSETNFLAGLKQAQWLGISVYYVNLRHDVDPKYYRLYKDSIKEFPINYLELMTTIRTIIQGDWHTPHIELPTNNLTNGTLNFKVPVTSTELKISLLSSSAGYADLKNVKTKAAVQGKFINVFKVKAPSTNEFEIAVNYPKGTGLTLDVIPTTKGKLHTDYSRSLTGDTLEITPVYDDDTLSKILGDKFFEGKTVKLLINEKTVEGTIQNGVITLPLDDIDENISVQKIYFEDVGIIFDGDDTAQIFIKKIPYAALILALVGLMTIAGLSYLIYRKRNKAAYIENTREMFEVDEKTFTPSAEKILPKNVKNNNFSYSGKLMIYVIKTPDSEDIPPREFNLFRMNSAQIPLNYILEQCAVDKFFEQVKNIFINPAKNGIVIENQSDCTITKRNNLIETGDSTELYYNDSVNISTDDETAELILQYKSLKPS